MMDKHPPQVSRLHGRFADCLNHTLHSPGDASCRPMVCASAPRARDIDAVRDRRAYGHGMANLSGVGLSHGMHAATRNDTVPVRSKYPRGSYA